MIEERKWWWSKLAKFKCKNGSELIFDNGKRRKYKSAEFMCVCERERERCIWKIDMSELREKNFRPLLSLTPAEDQLLFKFTQNQIESQKNGAKNMGNKKARRWSSDWVLTGTDRKMIGLLAWHDRWTIFSISVLISLILFDALKIGESLSSLPPSHVCNAQQELIFICKWGWTWIYISSNSHCMRMNIAKF